MTRTAILIAVMALCTAAMRFLPFLIFANGRDIPPYLLRLGRKLPQAIIGMLVVYCLRELSFTVSPYGLPEAIALAAVVLLHIWKRNSLVSILGGTVIYMFMVQIIF